MNRVVHFEIQADNPERAADFYRSVFDWKIDKWEGADIGDYWIIMTGQLDSEEPGINGGLLKRPAKVPPDECGTNSYVCTVQVDDFDAVAKKIELAGGRVAMPKFDLGGMAWQGYYIDPEGNTFGIHQVVKKPSDSTAGLSANRKKKSSNTRQKKTTARTKGRLRPKARSQRRGRR